MAKGYSFEALVKLVFGKQDKTDSLSAISPLTPTQDKFPYFTGTLTAALTTITGFARTLLGKTNAVEVLTELGISDSSGYVGRKIAEKWITASTTYTPPAGVKKIKVTIVGAGGGGGAGSGNGNTWVSAGSGGGAGATAIKTYDITSSTKPFTVTIGLGGRAGVWSTGEPTVGGTSTFDTMVALGGNNGTNCGSIPFGATQLIPNGGGGTSSGGDYNLLGGSGGQATIFGTGYVSGFGGHSSISAGGQPISASMSMNGIDGVYGSGGSGAFVLANSSARNGGRGGDGVCIIEEYA